MKRCMRFLAVPVFVVLVSCMQNGTPAASEPPTEAPKASMPAGGDGEWGTVKGRVTWGGDGIPKPAVIDTSREAKCVAKGGGPITSDEWLINPENKGVRYVFVWLRAEEDKAKLPVHPDLAKLAEKDKKVVVDQPCCMFEPHGLALRSGQVLVAKNSSTISHNVDWSGIRQQGGNNLVPAGGEMEITMKPSDYAITVKCGIHPWMKGWVRVFDHPYFAVTDADGNFEIKNAPVGKWKMVVWHETGWRNQETGKKGDPIEIKAGANDVGTLEIKLRKD